MFLIDGIGALVSSFSLGIVLVKFNDFFGIPADVLYILAVVPIFFFVYDFYMYFFQIKNLSYFLRLIAIANLLYCLLSIGLAFVHKESLKMLGWLYISIEILIILILARIEFKLARSEM